MLNAISKWTFGCSLALGEGEKSSVYVQIMIKINYLNQLFTSSLYNPLELMTQFHRRFDRSKLKVRSEELPSH